MVFRETLNKTKSTRSHEYTHRSDFVTLRFIQRVLRKEIRKAFIRSVKGKKWKDKMPTFAPEMLDFKVHTWEEMAGAMCQSEVVHSIIAVLCFVPILATLVWGTFWVFFITSVLSACVESMFVIMQRYNRPRVKKMIEKQKRFNR